MNGFISRAVVWLIISQVGQVEAAIVLTENFNHISGALQADPAWNAVSGTAGMTVTDGVVMIGAGDADLTTAFGTSLAPLYFGLDVRVSDASASAYVFGLRDSSSFAARFFLDDISDGYRLGVNSGAGASAGAFASESLFLNQTYRLVGYADGTGTVAAWIDPGSTEALSPHVSFFNADVGNFGAFYLRQGDAWDNGAASWTADNLVVATSFAEVMAVAVPEPSGIAVLASLAAGIWMNGRRRLRRWACDRDRGAVAA
ncbi:MAG: hypothetical protein ACO1RT_00605 [Planctomycetaceae bacterium]